MRIYQEFREIFALDMGKKKWQISVKIRSVCYGK